MEHPDTPPSLDDIWLAPAEHLKASGFASWEHFMANVPDRHQSRLVAYYLVGFPACDCLAAILADSLCLAAMRCDTATARELSAMAFAIIGFPEAARDSVANVAWTKGPVCGDRQFRVSE